MTTPHHPGPGGAGRPASRRLVRRGTQLLLGLLLYAASMAVLLRSGTGNMPWDVLHEGLAIRSGLAFGVVVVITGALVLLAWWPLRQRPGTGTVANVVVIAVAIGPLLAALPAASGRAAGAVMLVAGVAVNALATALYVGARLGPGPRDGLMTGLVRRTGGSVRVVRTGIEVAVVAVGWALGGTFGVGTVLYALAIGPLVQLLLPRVTVPVPVPPIGAGG